jgi:hypothetical protein
MVAGTRRTITGVENLMANASHLSLLKKGVKAWNEWRIKREPHQADLRRADLGGALLIEANLGGALLIQANLRGANLNKAFLSGADLNEANLSGADLSGAKLFSVVLDGVNFERATVGYTIFGRIDLSICSGLDSVKHFAPSTLGVDSIIRSNGRIPEIFLRGVGLPGTSGSHTFRRWLEMASSSSLASSATAAWTSPSPFGCTTPSSSRELDVGWTKSSYYPVTTYQESWNEAFTYGTNSCSVLQNIRLRAGG